MTTLNADNSQPGVLRVLQARNETTAFYDKISRVYDVLSERTERPARRAGLEMLQARAGERILEIGCGSGHCLNALAQAVGGSGSVHGLDRSSGMLRAARRLLVRAGCAGRVSLCRGDAVGVPFGRACFDAVFMSFTLELFDTPEIPIVMSECKRVLAPSGRLVVVGLSKAAASGVVLRALEWGHFRFPGFLDCRPIYVNRALDAAGFKVNAVSMLRRFVPLEIVLATMPTRE